MNLNHLTPTRAPLYPEPGLAPPIARPIRPPWLPPPCHVECVRFIRKRHTATKEDVMRRSLLTVGIVVAMVAAWSIGRLQAQGDKVIYVSSSHATYSPMQASNPSVTTSALWGDSNAGAHGTFTKFVPGYDAGMHSHTNDVWIVGIKGAYLYK